MLCGDEGHVVLPRPGHAPFQGGGQEDAGYPHQLGAGFVGEFDLVVDPVGRIFHRLHRGLTHGQQLGDGAAELCVPEVFGIPVTIVHRHPGEAACGDPVDDGVVVLLLHEDLVDPEDEVGAEFRGDAVEIVVGGGVAVQQAGLVVLCVVQRIHPGAFKDLEALRDDLGILPGRIGLFAQPVLQGEDAVFHLLLRRISGEAHPHRFLEVFAFVGNEVEGALFILQQALGRVGGIAAAQQHSVVFLACNVVGLTERIGAEAGLAVVGQGPHHDGGHGEKGGGLVEIVHDAKILEAAHMLVLLYSGDWVGCGRTKHLTASGGPDGGSAPARCRAAMRRQVRFQPRGERERRPRIRDGPTGQKCAGRSGRAASGDGC